MSTDMVSIGCRLPNGIRLEVGFSVNSEGKGGAPFAQYRRHKDYKCVVLRGLNQHSILRDVNGRAFGVKPAQAGREPVITQVPKDFWERWLSKNKDQWIITSGNVFVVPQNNPETIKAATLDAEAKSPRIFEPMSQTAAMKIEDHSLSRRVDE